MSGSDLLLGYGTKPASVTSSVKPSHFKLSKGWYGVALATAAVLLFVYLYSSSTDTSSTPKTLNSFSKSDKSPETGWAPELDIIRGPSFAIPVRRHSKRWIVNVPLTPFKSPLSILPPTTLPSSYISDIAVASPVRDQGYCGCCWAFTVCDVLSHRAGLAMPLSVQQLLSCFDKSGCDGGSPEDACRFMADRGLFLVSEKSIPYTQSQGGYVTTPCTNASSQLAVGARRGSVHSLAEFIGEKDPDPEILRKNVRNMKTALVAGGPFFCAMTVYDNLFSFDGTTVYSSSDSRGEPQGGHAIEIVGYSDAGVDKRPGFKKAYWVCRNSWGTGWAPRSPIPGYFCIEMGANVCGVESRCGYADPVVVG